MSFFRVNKSKDYTIVSNFHLRDLNISLKAKGLLTVMLSFPDDWDFSIAGLAKINREETSAIKSTLRELKANGYLVIRKIMPHDSSSGRIEYIYDIFEKPYTEKQEVEKQEVEKQEVEFQPLEIQPVEIQEVEKQEVENRRQLNTKELNTKELNTKELNTKEEKAAVVVNLYNSICRDLPAAVVYEKIICLVNKNKGFDFKLLFQKAQDSDFVSGRNGKFKASLEWILRNSGKIISGFYDNRGKVNQLLPRDASYDISVLERIVDPFTQKPIGEKRIC